MIIMRNRITLYRQLKGFLAVYKYMTPPRQRKQIEDERFVLPLNLIRWMPQLKENYRRLTLREFLGAYCR